MTTTTAVFLLTDAHIQSLPAIKAKLLERFEAVPLGPFTLDYVNYRSVEANDQSLPRFQHILRLSHRPGKAFVTVSHAKASQTDATAKEHVISIPSQQLEAFSTLLRDRFAALWTPRSALRVTNGVAYEVGEFVIKLGEIRQLGGQIRGVLCCVEIKHSSASENRATNQEYKATKSLLSDAWTSIGFDGAKEFFSSYPTEVSGEEGFDEARLWGEVLCLRA